MSNQRASNQTLIAIAVHKKLLQSMDHACTLTGEDRSTFIRQAIVNIIRQRKGVVQDEWVRAQVRARGAHRYEPSPLPPPAAAAKRAGRLAIAKTNGVKPNGKSTARR